MTTELRVKPNPDVVFTRFDETSAALLHLKTKRYYTLNETGSLIWDLVSQEVEVNGIASRLTEVYDVGADEARDYVIEFLSNLRREGLLL